MNIKGKVVHQNLGTGFWGIIADNGKQYEPVNLPKKFQKENQPITLKAKESDSFSLFMWGTPIEIISAE